MSGIAPARKRAAITAVIVTALVAVAGVIALGVAASSGDRGNLAIGTVSPSPTRRAAPGPAPVPLPRNGPDVAARFNDPVGVGALLRRARAEVAALVRAPVTAIGLATLSGTRATALAFVPGARYAVALSAADGGWRVTGVVRHGAVGSGPPGTPGLADAVLAARRAVVHLLTGTGGGDLATTPYRPELVRVAARLYGSGKVRIDASAVTVTTGDSATVLVAATRNARAFRFVLTVARPGYDWKVGDLRLEP